MKKIKKLDVKARLLEMRLKGLPRFAHIEDFLSFRDQIIIDKINEIIEALNDSK